MKLSMDEKPFSISGALREGWELTKVNIGFLIAYQLILFFLMFLFSDRQEHHGGVSHTMVYLIGWVLIALGKMGFCNCALLLTKGFRPSFDQFYKNWRLILYWIAAAFLYGIMLTFGLALLIIPGLFVLSAFSLYPFFILDKGYGPIEALKESAEITKGIRKHVLLFILACIGIVILGFLCFGIGLLIAVPVTLIAMASVYEKLTGQAKSSIQPDDIIV